MSNLSPAAQAVLNAAEDSYGFNYSDFYCCADRVAAAALRAAADQVVPEATGFSYTKQDIRAALLAIANELEQQLNKD